MRKGVELWHLRRQSRDQFWCGGSKSWLGTSVMSKKYCAPNGTRRPSLQQAFPISESVKCLNTLLALLGPSSPHQSISAHCSTSFITCTEPRKAVASMVDLDLV